MTLFSFLEQPVSKEPSTPAPKIHYAPDYCRARFLAAFNYQLSAIAFLITGEVPASDAVSAWAKILL